MCITASVNGSMVTYELKSLNQLGWMAIGFGTSMSNSAHVILWKNADDKVTISQRRSPGQVEPLLDPSPPRVATLSPRTNLSSITSPTLAFDIPKNNDTLQQLVWAFGITPPSNSSPSADLEQHLDAGPFTLNLTKFIDIPDIPSPTQTSSTASNTSSTSSSPTSSGLQNGAHSMTLVAHAVLSFIGFLVLLPFTALLARWTRTRTTHWFKAHWILNAVVGLPITLVGWLLGPLSVSQQNRVHVVNEHQIFGVILFALYVVQMTLGTLIHLRRPKHGGNVHPPRNVVHVILGIVIIIGSFFQVKTGISRDWQLSPEAAQIATVVWICWTIAIPMVYFAGLKHLKTQFDQERLGWHEPIVAPPILRAAAIRRASEETLSERGRIIVPPVLVDDGTHDIFSRRRAHEPDPDATEMRELERPVPISVHA
ncbi:hypothetical protein QCA50_002773 [Cerrena zonata]|uniref:Cytochrome b561 domain-containing protein n=1 Tax=Cerrena zonata TaxID=2478898 RepID=A0AAW0GTC1_9APHY